MRESDMPPPGDPSMRGTRVWGLLIIAAIAVFIIWFAAENWRAREPGRNPAVPVVPHGG